MSIIFGETGANGKTDKATDRQTDRQTPGITIHCNFIGGGNNNRLYYNFITIYYCCYCYYYTVLSIFLLAKRTSYLSFDLALVLLCRHVSIYCRSGAQRNLDEASVL